MLTATRALEQINNQIRALQNQASMLQNMAKNLERLDVSTLGRMQAALTRIDGLMIEAEGLNFNLEQFEVRWRQQHPQGYDAMVRTDDIVRAARSRWQDAMGAFRRTMQVQAQIVTNVQGDRQLLSDLVTRSQGAAGALQVQQAANQLIALSTKQQMQIQTLMAAQYRAEAQDMARKAQAEEAARETTRRFLGSGSAYTAE